MTVKTSAKSLTETFSGSSYDIVAWARGHDVLYYRQFGSYQGEWFMLSFCKDEYYLWKGNFGSCSGCDDLQASLETTNLTRAGATEFASRYVPFIEIPSHTFTKLVVKGVEAVNHIMPANINDDYSGFKMDGVLKDVCLLVKLKEKIPVSVKDIMEVVDQEVKQNALKAYGYEKFCKDAKAKTLDKDKKGNSLLGIEDIKLVSLKDSSTDRMYLLRVPPTVNTLKAGVAWTFNMAPEDYEPVVET